MDLTVWGRKEAASSLAVINTPISSHRVWFLALMSFSANLTSWESLGGRGMHHSGNAKRAHSGRKKKEPFFQPECAQRLKKRPIPLSSIGSSIGPAGWSGNEGCALSRKDGGYLGFFTVEAN